LQKSESHLSKIVFNISVAFIHIIILRKQGSAIIDAQSSSIPLYGQFIVNVTSKFKTTKATIIVLDAIPDILQTKAILQNKHTHFITVNCTKS
jgi:hypothetical protein